MSEPAKVIVLSPEELKSIVREAVAEAMDNNKITPTPPPPKDWLKADELSKLYGLPRTWFEERGRIGDIARTKPGRYILFKRRDVEEYFERSKKKAEGKKTRKKKNTEKA